MKDSSLVSYAYGYLRDQIISYKFQPGEHLSDYHIAKSLKMSRAPIREALLRLHMDGLVQTNDDGKIYVTSINMDEIADILNVRRALESEALSLIAENNWLTAQQEASLLEIHEKLKKHSRGECPDLNYEYDDLFHQQLASYSQSPRIVKMLKQLQLQMQRARWISILNHQRSAEALAEHQNLLEAILAKDQALAVSCLRVHIQNSAQAFRSILESEQIPKIAATISSFISASGTGK